MPRFRKKAIVIEAMRWCGRATEDIAWFVNAGGLLDVTEDGGLNIRTLEGTMVATPGDWIVRGVAGEMYPVKPNIFEATYEPVEAAEETQCEEP